MAHLIYKRRMRAGMGRIWPSPGDVVSWVSPENRRYLRVGGISNVCQSGESVERPREPGLDSFERSISCGQGRSISRALAIPEREQPPASGCGWRVLHACSALGYSGSIERSRSWSSRGTDCLCVNSRRAPYIYPRVNLQVIQKPPGYSSQSALLNQVGHSGEFKAAHSWCPLVCRWSRAAHAIRLGSRHARTFGVSCSVVADCSSVWMPLLCCWDRARSPTAGWPSSCPSCFGSQPRLLIGVAHLGRY